jgi:hypothetical protein
MGIVGSSKSGENVLSRSRSRYDRGIPRWPVATLLPARQAFKMNRCTEYTVLCTLHGGTTTGNCSPIRPPTHLPARFKTHPCESAPGIATYGIHERGEARLTQSQGRPQSPFYKPWYCLPLDDVSFASRPTNMLCLPTIHLPRGPPRKVVYSFPPRNACMNSVPILKLQGCTLGFPLPHEVTPSHCPTTLYADECLTFTDSSYTLVQSDSIYDIRTPK